MSGRRSVLGRRHAGFLAALALLLPLGSPVAGGPIPGPGESAGAGERAERGASWKTATVESCDLATVRALATRHRVVGQFVVTTTGAFADTYGTTFVAARRGDDWVCQTPSVLSRTGRSGTRPLLDRRSGDGTTPAGVFPLGEVEAWDGQRVNVFGNHPDPGVRDGIGYRSVHPDDCWGTARNQPRYNHLVRLPGCPNPDEWLPRYGDVYGHAVVIGANNDPVTGEVSGDEPGEIPYAAAIFLHRHSYSSSGATRPTSGCVSVAMDHLVDVVRLLDPDLDPHVAIGPVDWLRTQA